MEHEKGKDRLTAIIKNSAKGNQQLFFNRQG
jgi:hypothetical protein